MFRILVCDNEKEDLNEIVRTLSHYIDEDGRKDWELIISCDACEVRAMIESGQKFSAYFLDILMPKVTGIDIGRLIRRLDEDVPIIYTTSSREFAFEAYDIHALSYLEKPVHTEKLRWAMEKIRPRGQVEYASFKTKEGVQRVLLDDIVYAENVSRSVQLNMLDGSRINCLCIRITFEKSLESLMEQPQFIQSHKSFVLNMKNVSQLRSDCFVMEGGRKIPISRGRMVEVKKAYLKYIAETGV